MCGCDHGSLNSDWNSDSKIAHTKTPRWLLTAVVQYYHILRSQISAYLILKTMASFRSDRAKKPYNVSSLQPHVTVLKLNNSQFWRTNSGLKLARKLRTACGFTTKLLVHPGLQLTQMSTKPKLASTASLSSQTYTTRFQQKILLYDLCLFPLFPPLLTFVLLQAIFGQIGTLVREPLIRVRSSECTEFTWREPVPTTFDWHFRTFKYDRSGRSSGVAIITFETPAEATRAKKQFDGILAKGKRFTFITFPHTLFEATYWYELARPTDVHRLRLRTTSNASPSGQLTRLAPQ